MLTFSGSLVWHQWELMVEQTHVVLLEPAEEGGYVVTCPALPGVVTEGDTIEEAVERAKEAIEVYLESILKDVCFLPRFE